MGPLFQSIPRGAVSHRRRLLRPHSEPRGRSRSRLLFFCTGHGSVGHLFRVRAYVGGVQHVGLIHHLYRSVVDTGPRGGALFPSRRPGQAFDARGRDATQRTRTAPDSGRRGRTASCARGLRYPRRGWAGVPGQRLLSAAIQLPVPVRPGRRPGGQRRLPRGLGHLAGRRARRHGGTSLRLERLAACRRVPARRRRDLPLLPGEPGRLIRRGPVRRGLDQLRVLRPGRVRREGSAIRSPG